MSRDPQVVLMARLAAVLGAKPPRRGRERRSSLVDMPKDVASGCMVVSDTDVHFDFSVSPDKAVAALRAIVGRSRPTMPRKLEVITWPSIKKAFANAKKKRRQNDRARSREGGRLDRARAVGTQR